MSPRSAHLRIFLAICRRTRCSSAPIERPLHARSRATSILASVRESKLSAIMTVFFIELQQSLQAQGLAGLPRFAKNRPCKSAAFRRIPACFIASFRSGPGGIVRASSRAASASASRSSLGRRSLFCRGMDPKIRQLVPVCLSGARLWNPSGSEMAIATGTLSAPSRQRPLNRRRRETLAFRGRYWRGAKEGKSNDQISCRYRHLGSICRRACHGPTTYSSGTGDAPEG